MSLINFQTATDEWYGFTRHVFDFEGREAWIVEPREALPGNPWTWCMEWPNAFVKRTGVPELLARGFHHVHLQAKGYACDADLVAFARYHDFLNRLGLAPRPGLIGMSFGGLYSVRYAAHDPSRVACMYLDAPVCSFKDFRHLDLVWEPYALRTREDLGEHPGMPVNLTRKVAGIPTLLVYGADDLVVSPKENAELFAARMLEDDAKLDVMKRNLWGHHPHGLDDPTAIVEHMLRNVSDPLN